MNAMADAVENSEFVIMCMSDSYKQSTYCQAEAEYAFNCKRRLIPLIMRPGYKPDGWLGFMIGSRIYVDFGRFDFDTGCEKLMTEISLQRKQVLPSKNVQMRTHQQPSPIPHRSNPISIARREKPAMKLNSKALGLYMRRKATTNFTQKAIEQWSESDVLDFLSNQRLTQLMPLCETMDGRALVQLYKMCTANSDRAYMLLNHELKSIYKINLPIGTYTRFLSAMEQRPAVVPMKPQAKPPANPPAKPPFIAPIVKPKKELKPVPFTQQRPVRNVPFDILTPALSGQYDIEITSDAPALQILRAVERYGLNFPTMTLVPSRYSFGV